MYRVGSVWKVDCKPAVHKSVKEGNNRAKEKCQYQFEVSPPLLLPWSSEPGAYVPPLGCRAHESYAQSIAFTITKAEIKVRRTDSRTIAFAKLSLF